MDMPSFFAEDFVSENPVLLPRTAKAKPAPPFFVSQPPVAPPPLPLATQVNNLASSLHKVDLPIKSPPLPAPLSSIPMNLRPSSSVPQPIRPSIRPSSSVPNDPPRPSKRERCDRDLSDYEFLPLRKRDPKMAELCCWPKMNPKPDDSPYIRSVKSRTAESRHEAQHADEAHHRGDGPCDSVPAPPWEKPWDFKGPLGPKDGGPHLHMKQVFRENTQRWANSGGQFREMWKKYYDLKKAGWRGARLQKWHPMQKNGHWAKLAHSEGQLAPW